MEQFKKRLEDLYNEELPITGTHFNQTSRNVLRDELLGLLCDDLNNEGIEAYRVEKGLALNVQNDIEGSIAILMNISIPGLDYDIDEEHDAWLDRQEKAKERTKKKD